MINMLQIIIYTICYINNIIKLLFFFVKYYNDTIIIRLSTKHDFQHIHYIKILIKGTIITTNQIHIFIRKYNVCNHTRINTRG